VSPRQSARGLLEPCSGALGQPSVGAIPAWLVDRQPTGSCLIPYTPTSPGTQVVTVLTVSSDARHNNVLGATSSCPTADINVPREKEAIRFAVPVVRRVVGCRPRYLDSLLQGVRSISRSTLARVLPK
jgi:hypothetical protein